VDLRAVCERDPLSLSSPGLFSNKAYTKGLPTPKEYDGLVQTSRRSDADRVSWTQVNGSWLNLSKRDRDVMAQSGKIGREAAKSPESGGLQAQAATNIQERKD